MTGEVSHTKDALIEMGAADCLNCKHLLALHHCEEDYYCLKRDQPDPQERAFDAEDLRACWEWDGNTTMENADGEPVKMEMEGAV